MSIFQPGSAVETSTPEPTATPKPTPTATPIPTPTPTPDPSAPTVEKAENKILELETQKRLLEARISQMQEVISSEESDMKSDWNTLQTKYDQAIREAEDSAVEVRYKTVKRKDVYGRERRVQVPYEHENLGAKSRIVQIKNAFQREKRVLQVRNQELGRKKRMLSEAELQDAEYEAHIEHLRKWIQMNGPER
jgi:hypothetical protein